MVRNLFMEESMSFVKRVMRGLSVSDYRKLDKNNRVDPSTGEMVPVFDEHGRELPDPVPVAPPVGWYKQPDMFEHMRNMIRSENLRMAAEAAGLESEEDANDFEVEDEMFPRSHYEDEHDWASPEEIAALRQSKFREAWLAERERLEMQADLDKWDGRTVPKPPVAPKSPPSRPPEPGSEVE